MKSKNWIDFNANKWGKDAPDCAIRSLVLGIEMDYEVICKKLGVACTPDKGYADDYGIDLYDLQEKFSQYLGNVEDDLDTADDPINAFLHAPSLARWLTDHAADNCRYLVYLDDDSQMDGGHIVYANCKDPNRPYFIDTSDVSTMPVQAWIRVKKTVPRSSRVHYKYDTKTKRFF